MNKIIIGLITVWIFAAPTVMAQPKLEFLSGSLYQGLTNTIKNNGDREVTFFNDLKVPLAEIPAGQTKIVLIPDLKSDSISARYKGKNYYFQTLKCDPLIITGELLCKLYIDTTYSYVDNTTRDTIEQALVPEYKMIRVPNYKYHFVFASLHFQFSPNRKISIYTKGKVPGAEFRTNKYEIDNSNDEIFLEFQISINPRRNEIQQGDFVIIDDSARVQEKKEFDNIVRKFNTVSPNNYSSAFMDLMKYTYYDRYQNGDEKKYFELITDTRASVNILKVVLSCYDKDDFFDREVTILINK